MVASLVPSVAGSSAVLSGETLKYGTIKLSCTKLVATMSSSVIGHKIHEIACAMPVPVVHGLSSALPVDPEDSLACMATVTVVSLATLTAVSLISSRVLAQLGSIPSRCAVTRSLYTILMS